MLIHHDARDYETAASEAATAARAKMHKIIEHGKKSATSLFERVHTQVPSDEIARGRALRFGFASNFASAVPAAKETLDADDPRAFGLDGANDIDALMNMVDIDGVRAPDRNAETLPAPADEQLRFCLSFADETQRARRVHDHALGQLAQRAGVPTRYLRQLVESDNEALRDLALEVLSTHYGKTSRDADRYLLRSVDGELRGFLSDRYRRLDNRPLLDAFAAACQSVGAVAVDGTSTDVRVQLKAYLPLIFEPIENEPMLVGLQWHNSDFGAGSHTLALTILRLACTNMAVLDSAIRDVHLGRRLPDDISFSEKTYQLDTEANASALGDCVRQLLGPEHVNALMHAVKATHEEQIDAWSGFAKSVRKHLSKHEITEAQRLFESDDVINLPPGKSVWRASNALSWIAGHTESADRRLELERIAGDVLRIPKQLTKRAA